MPEFNISNDHYKNKWFKESDLREILDRYKIHVNESEFDVCTPLTDIVRLKCNTDNIHNADGQEVKDKDGNAKKQYWKCTPLCSRYKTCSLRYVDKDMQHKWFFIEDLKGYLEKIRFVFLKKIWNTKVQTTIQSCISLTTISKESSRKRKK